MPPIVDLLIIGLVIIALSGLRVAQEYERTVSAEQQETITRDSVTIKVNAVLWYRIVRRRQNLNVIFHGDGGSGVHEPRLIGRA
jgi:regulator of protease activity HflC (stomatin/prohibitin superfamily)